MSSRQRSLARLSKRQRNAGGRSQGPIRFMSRRVGYNRETGETYKLDDFMWRATQQDPMSKRRRARRANKIARASRKANRR